MIGRRGSSEFFPAASGTMNSLERPNSMTLKVAPEADSQR
jgi:hypothetical protein